MTGVEYHLPEPLQSFSGLAEATAPALRNVDAIYVKYLEQKNAGRILANSVEAIRVELTYHSNAIEGSTLSLRETQLIIPFADGNGRTARLLMNYHLLRLGYPHTIIEVEKRAEYLAALEEANAGRCGRFAIFVIQSAERSIQKLIGDD